MNVCDDIISITYLEHTCNVAGVRRFKSRSRVPTFTLEYPSKEEFHANTRDYLLPEILLSPPAVDAATNINNILIDDCLQLVIEQLDVWDLLECAYVDQRFRTLAQHTYRRHFQHVTGECNFLRKVPLWKAERLFLQFGTSMEYVQLKDQADLQSFWVQNYCPNINTLDIDIDHHSTLVHLRGIVSRLTCMKMTITDPGLLVDFANIFVGQRLKLTKITIRAYMPPFLAFPIVQISTLHTLSVSGAYLTQIEEFAQHNPQITSLKLQSIRCTHSLDTILQYLPNLHRLELSGHCQLIFGNTGNYIAHIRCLILNFVNIPAAQNNLRCLELFREHNVPLESIILKALHDGVTCNELLDVIARMTSLAYLQVRKHFYRPTRQFVEVMEKLDNLSELDIHTDDQIIFELTDMMRCAGCKLKKATIMTRYRGNEKVARRLAQIDLMTIAKIVSEREIVLKWTVVNRRILRTPEVSDIFEGMGVFLLVYFL